VFLACRDISKGSTAVDKLKAEGLNQVEFIELDVTADRTVDAARISIESKTGALDAFVNNAGISGGWPQSSLEASVEQYKKVFDTNLYGVVRVTQAFINILKNAQSPRIVNVSSSGSSLTLHSDPNWQYYDHKAALYPSSKAALNMYTIDLAYQLRGTNFKVNAVCPGFVATDFNGHRGTGTVQQAADRISRYVMIGADVPTGKFIAEEYNPITGETPW